MRAEEETTLPTKKRVTRSHIIQSLIAGIYVLLAFGVMHFAHSELAVTSLGASAFIVFSCPTAKSSQPRILIGSYCLGSLSGFLGNVLIISLQDIFPLTAYIPICALAVVVSMFLMTVLNFEHPPAAALAVAVTIDTEPIRMILAGLCSILLLCVLKKALKKYICNL